MMQAGGQPYFTSGTMCSLAGLRRVEERIAGFLSWLAQIYGQGLRAGSARSTFRLTHQETSDVALLHHPLTVTRVLGLSSGAGFKMAGQRPLVISHSAEQS